MDYKKEVATISNKLRLARLKKAILISAIVEVLTCLAFYAYTSTQKTSFYINNHEKAFLLLVLLVGVCWAVHEFLAIRDEKRVATIILPKLFDSVYGSHANSGINIKQLQGRSVSELSEDEVAFLSYALNNNLIKADDVLTTFDLKLLSLLDTKWQALDIIKTSNHPIHTSSKRQGRQEAS